MNLVFKKQHYFSEFTFFCILRLYEELYIILYLKYLIDEITRDYQSNVTDLKMKDAMLYPWDNKKLNLDEVQDNWVEKYIKELESTQDEKPTNGFHELQIKSTPPYAVYSTSQYKKYITNKNFYLEEDKEKADILYIEGHYKDIKLVIAYYVKNKFPILKRFCFHFILNVFHIFKCLIKNFYNFKISYKNTFSAQVVSLRKGQCCYCIYHFKK